jgi:hypothetical protein
LATPGLVWVSEVVSRSSAQDAAGGVDLLDGQLDTVLEVGAGVAPAPDSSTMLAILTVFWALAPWEARPRAAAAASRRRVRCMYVS